MVLSSSSGTAAAAVLDSWLRPARFLQLFPAARGHWCNLPARPTPHARQHTILTTPARPWPTVRVPQSGRILSNDEPVVLDLSASGLRLAHSTGSAPPTGLAAASTWRLTCPLASAALFGPRPAAPVGPRPPRLPCASRSVALLHPPLSGSSTPGRRAGLAWAPALGSHCELRGHGCLRAECVRLPDGRRARPHLAMQGRTTVPVCVWS